jgi:hypothetical protein
MRGLKEPMVTIDLVPDGPRPDRPAGGERRPLSLMLDVRRLWRKIDGGRWMGGVMEACARRLVSGLVALCALVAWAGVAVVTTGAAAPTPAYALDDGLARTPPMGFNNWNDTFCGAEFNENYVRAIADLMVSSGLRDAGYRYVNLDDCWARPQRSPAGSRDAAGHLVPDRSGSRMGPRRSATTSIRGA